MLLACQRSELAAINIDWGRLRAAHPPRKVVYVWYLAKNNRRAFAPPFLTDSNYIALPDPFQSVSVN